jgi:outer membrane protein TolC
LRTWCIVVAAVAVLPACVPYRAQPLRAEATLAHRIPDILVDARQMPRPELASHRYDPSDGLDFTEVAMLAVASNPDLRTARADAGIWHAQAFAAGLLPDPQLTLTADVPDPGQVAKATAYNLGLHYDINALLTRSPRRAAARQDARKADLTLLWLEWQVVAQARVLFVRLTEAVPLRDALEQDRALFADVYGRTQAALERGLLTLVSVTPHLTALQDVLRQIHDLERQVNLDRHDLSALLGVSPEVPVPLVGPAAVPELDEAAVEGMIPDLPRRRPDLIALQAGYAAQELRYRVAILGQFPALNVGFTRAQDTTPIHTTGLSVSLSVPIFSRNRGPIAIEQATRQKLYEEYQARLDLAVNGVHRILTEQRINRRQLEEVDRGLADLVRAAAKTREALRSRDIDALTFANLEAALLAKRIEKIGLERSILEQQVALSTLAGGDLPVRLAPEGSPR